MELYSPERLELDRRVEQFESEQLARIRRTDRIAIAAGVTFGAFVVLTVISAVVSWVP